MPERRLTPIEALRYAAEALEKEEPSEAIKEKVEQARQDLETNLNQRFQEFGQPADFHISSPEIPENLTPEHLKALSSIFGQNNLEMMILAQPKELENLDETYAAVMYPETQREQDEKRGLTSKRPVWFNQPSDQTITQSTETWGQVYARSMEQQTAELTKSGNRIILVETIQIPKYTDGSQQYGALEAKDQNQSKDPLLPIIQKVFGQDANRFNHSWDEITQDFKDKAEKQRFIQARQQEQRDYSFDRQGLKSSLTLIKEKIQNLWQNQGLSIPDFDVLLCPALIFNQQTTFNHPENSQANAWERTSTPLKDKNNQDTGLCLDVGYSGHGGASDAAHAPRGDRYDYGGFRFAVVFYPPKS